MTRIYKQTIALITLLILSAGVNAQTLERSVIGTLGGYSAPAGGPQLLYNMGETNIATLQNGGYMLTQGFEQPVTNVPAISGADMVCVSSPITLSDALTGGIWISASTAVATVGSLSGIVTGVSGGTATISYALYGDTATTVVTVSTLPNAGAITGPSSACVGTPVTFTNATADFYIGQSYGGGVVAYVLQPGDPGYDASVTKGLIAATSDQSSGIQWYNGSYITTGASGTVIGTGDANTAAIIAAQGTGSYAASICTAYNGGGYTDWYLPSLNELNELYINKAAIGGFSPNNYWSSSESGSNGARFESFGNGALGNTGKGSGNYVRAVRSFTAPSTSTWSSSNTNVATISATGSVSAVSQGTVTINYTVINGCSTAVASKTFSVDATPATIAGNSQLCTGGLNTQLSNNGSPDGVWSSSNAAAASVDAATGLVTSGTTGNQGVTTISYDDGCAPAASVTFSVDATPDPISGNSQMCAGGSTITLGNNGSPSGVWSGGTTAIATVNSVTGVVSPGTTQGTTTFTYSDGCGSAASVTATVNATPAPIAGNAPLCADGSTVTLTNTSTNGTWSSSNPSVASVNTLTGMVQSTTGSTIGGTAVITYDNGCAPAATTTVTVNGLPVIHTFTGGGGYCVGEPGVHIGLTLSDTGISYQLYNGAAAEGTPVVGTGTAIDFGVFSDTGVYHAVATNIHTACTNYLSGVTVHLNALPAVFNVTGGGSYCASGAGMPVGLDGSASGINYELYNGTAPLSSLSGTGAALDFGQQTATGPYSVIATDAVTGCSQTMADTVSVIVLPLPTDYSMTGGGGYCAGDTGVHVGLVNSDAGTDYQLYYNGGTDGGTVTGTGAALDFGLQTNGGTYSIIATNPVTTCVTMVTASVTVTENPLPIVYNVTGGGVYCAGGAGVHIGLDNADPGIRYQLTLGAFNSGAAVNGAGSVLDFGTRIIPGTYTAVATDTLTGCMSTMNDSAVITVSLPVTPQVQLATNAGSGDTVCTGSMVTFTGQTVNGGTGPDYQWYVNGANVAGGVQDSTYTYLPNSGDAVSVVLTSDATCATPATVTDTMNVQTQDPLPPSVFILVRTLTEISIGQPDTLIAVPTNCGSSPHFQWYLNGTVIAGATSAVYISSTFANGDSVSCQVITSGPCGGQLTYNSVIITVYPAGVVQVSGNSSDIRLIPNPNRGTFTVKGMLSTTADETVNMEITDMLGQVVYKAGTVAHNGVLDERIQLSGTLANGMYLLNLVSQTGHQVFHFVIEQ